MKVYVVEHREKWEGAEVIGVYSSQEEAIVKADYYLSNLSWKSSCDSVTVTEYEVGVENSNLIVWSKKGK